MKRRNLPLLMLQSREQLMTHFRPILNAQGITEQQWRVIRALHDHGALEPRVIGDLCRLSSPSLAGVLARMEQMNLVARKRWDNDQRRVRVTLTARSRKMVMRIAPLIEAAYFRVEQRLGKPLCDALYGMLDVVVQKLKGAGLSGEVKSGGETDPASEKDHPNPE